MSDAQSIFRLKALEIPWGDYGDILNHGMSMHQSRRDGLILLERTGPSISPITFPGAGDLVVTEDFRTGLEKSGLTGFTFLPVIKHHIVDLDWESWDITAKEPVHYPESGEPEDYILSEEHSQEASDALGWLSELVSHDGLDVERNDADVRLLAETWDGTDFFRAKTTRINCVSLKAKTWLERHYGDYVIFLPLN